MLIPVSVAFSVAAEEGALHLKLCILIACAMTRSKQHKMFMSSPARAEGYDKTAKQHKDSTAFMCLRLCTLCEARRRLPVGPYAIQNPLKAEFKPHDSRSKLF